MRGHLYVLYNPMFVTYGEDVYKLGRTCNLNDRIKSYITSYVEKSMYMYTSTVFDNCIEAEYVLFYLLRKFRLKNNREFFQCNLDEIIGVICVLETMDKNVLNQTYKNIISKTVNVISEDIKNVNLNPKQERARLTKADREKRFEDFFEEYRFKPKNPADYFKYGYKTDIRKEIVKLSNSSFGYIDEPMIELEEKFKDQV